MELIYRCKYNVILPYATNLHLDLISLTIFACKHPQIFIHLCKDASNAHI